LALTRLLEKFSICLINNGFARLGEWGCGGWLQAAAPGSYAFVYVWVCLGRSSVLIRLQATVKLDESVRQ